MSDTTKKIQFSQTGDAMIDFSKTDITFEEFQRLDWVDANDFLLAYMRDISMNELIDWNFIQE